MDKQRKTAPRPARGEVADPGRIGHPLDFIAEDHMREREICTLIDRIVDQAPIPPCDRDRLVLFLSDQLPRHLEDEETDLFPMMLRRCDPEDEIHKVIDRLTADHGHAHADAPAMLALIQAGAAGLTRDARRRLADFARHSRRHLVLENAIILPIARARLTATDLRRMKRHMLERRGLAASGHD